MPNAPLVIANPTAGGRAARLVHLDGEPFGGLPMRIDLHAARLIVAATLR